MVPSKNGLISITFFTVWEPAGSRHGLKLLQCPFCGQLHAKQSAGGYRTDVLALARSGIYANNNTVLKHEPERGCTMQHFDGFWALSAERVAHERVGLHAGVREKVQESANAAHKALGKEGGGLAGGALERGGGYNRGGIVEGSLPPPPLPATRGMVPARSKPR